MSTLAPGSHRVHLSAEYANKDGILVDPWQAGGNLQIVPHTNLWTIAAVSDRNQLLEVNASTSGNGAVVDTWETTMSGTSVQANETWKAVADPNNPGWSQMINEATGKCLEVNGSTRAIDQWDCVSGAANELWTTIFTNHGQTLGGQLLQVKSDGSGRTADIGLTSLPPGDGTPVSLQTTQTDATGWVLTEQP